MARCPNCARTVRFWHNYSGYCTKQCRTESITSCPGCGKVGLYKHERLGCCSEECRCWYVASLLGYDKEALVTPAWDKIVYHVRLPSNSAGAASGAAMCGRRSAGTAIGCCKAAAATAGGSR